MSSSWEGPDWGGRRRGAGRRRVALRRLVPHRRRPERAHWQPLHLTTRIVAGLPELREPRAQRVLLTKLREGSARFGFRLIEYSVQSTHFHLLVEVPNRVALTRGAKGLFVRLAKALNKLWGRKGRVFADRFHAAAKSTRRAVRNALVYVLHNARKHGRLGRELDPFSSSPWFDGYRSGRARGPLAGLAQAPPLQREPRAPFSAPARGASRSLDCLGVEALRALPRVTRPARSWLLSRGWRSLGLIDPDEGPSMHELEAWMQPGWRRVRAVPQVRIAPQVRMAPQIRGKAQVRGEPAAS